MSNSKQAFRHFTALLRYAAPYRKAVVLQLALMAVSVGAGLLKPWPIKVLVDNVAGGDPLVIASVALDYSWQTLLILTCLVYLVLHAGEALVQVGSGTIAALTSSRMIRDLRTDLLRRLQSLSLGFHDAHSTGDLVHRVTYNSTSAETAFQSGFMGLVKSSLMLAGMLVIMLLMNWKLTAVAAAVIPLLLITIKWYARRTHQASLAHQNQEGKVSSLLQEVLGAIRLVKAYDRVDVEQQRFEETCTASVRTRLKSQIIQKTFGFLTATILAAGTALLFWTGIREVQAGELTIGEFLVFTAYLAMLYGPLSVLSYTSSSINSALGGGTRLFEILESEPDVTEKEDAVEHETLEDCIEARGVTFGYDEKAPVLRDLSVRIERGRTIGIVGETGGGKSTLLSLLMRFYDPQEGAILIDGVDIRDMTLHSLRSMFAYVPQDNQLLSGTLRENIVWGRPDATMREIEDAARIAEAHTFIMEKPEGYDSAAGERGVRLSAGQRQRIALARAFLRDAPVLLLDEPTSALDATTEERIIRNLRERPGRTVLFVAHRLSTVHHADTILVISGGRVAESGSHDELLERRGIYHRLWTSQTAGYQTQESTVAG